MRVSIEQILAENCAWCKNDPDFAANIVQPPAKFTKFDKRVAALDYDLRKLIPTPAMAQRCRNPFGAIFDAFRDIAMGNGKRHGRFTDAISRFDSDDPLAKAKFAIDSVLGSIRAHGVSNQMTDTISKRCDDTRKNHGEKPVRALMTVAKATGYTVDVSKYCEGRAALLAIEGELSTNDKRRSVVYAARQIIDAYSYSLMHHLSEDHKGKLFYMEFVEGDLNRYRYRHDDA